MARADFRPKLRPVDVVVLSEPKLGPLLQLRDTQGIAPHPATFPMAARAVLARFDGHHTCAEIARLVSRAEGAELPVDIVVRIANELDERLFLVTPRFRAARRDIERAFKTAHVRPAAHAGGAYHRDATELADYINVSCIETARAAHAIARTESEADETPLGDDAKLVGLIAPHIDPWRGARSYGEAYGRLAQHLPDDVTTFVLFGTSHAPMAQPFALCRKAFATPFGAVSADFEAIDEIARAATFDPYEDEFNHKREHSLEFQVVFLRHLLGDRPIRIVPILAGLGREQASGESPRKSVDVERFLEAVSHVVATRNAVVVAGADLAHVGPRFGDPRPLGDKQRRALEATDRESLDHAANLDAERFFHHVARDLDTRRVCGLAPIYALLRTIESHVRGKLDHYEQTVDSEEGSIVSHAALGFFR